MLVNTHQSAARVDLIRDRRQLALVVALLFSSAVCVLLFSGRVIHARSFTHGGMVWNLFLAWLPMLASLAAYNLAGKGGRATWLIIAGCALLWLLFFPNAPYILTDLVNLRPRYNVPYWYDVLMYVAFAWTGTLLGLVSLYLMQVLVSRGRGRGAGWLFAVVALALSGFGVYLGRFPRYNSWDVFISPIDLLADIWDRVSHPLANGQMFAFSALFSLFMLSIYLVLVAVVGLRSERQEI
ncbi:MAG TPA: DUF1361 domain-containing protein [Anaerolineae bacterium]